MGFVDGPNLYGYVGNDPIAAYAPYGLRTVRCDGDIPDKFVDRYGDWVNRRLFGTKRVSSANDIKNAVEDAISEGAPVTHVILAGHGDPGEASIGNVLITPFTINSASRFGNGLGAEVLFDLDKVLPEDVPIELGSCNTGSGEKGDRPRKFSSVNWSNQAESA